MKHLFDKSLVINNETLPFKIFETVENSFFAECTLANGLNSFHFHRMKTDWVSDDPARQSEAESLGKEIDQKG